jgi:hypothetical protein
MFKCFYLLLVEFLLLTSCSIRNDKVQETNLAQRDIKPFGYIYHFYKNDFEKSHIVPSEYKPKLYILGGSVSARLYPADTLIRFVMKGKNKKGQFDSSIEFFKRIELTAKQKALVPTNLLGCYLLGVYNSLDEDADNAFYNCFYLSDQNDLLKVIHLFKPGNVSAAFFYTKDSISPMIKYKKDIVKLLALERPLNMTDTIHAKF